MHVPFIHLYLTQMHVLVLETPTIDSVSWNSLIPNTVEFQVISTSELTEEQRKTALYIIECTAVISLQTMTLEISLTDDRKEMSNLEYKEYSCTVQLVVGNFKIRKGPPFTVYPCTGEYCVFITKIGIASLCMSIDVFMYSTTYNNGNNVL